MGEEEAADDDEAKAAVHFGAFAKANGNGKGAHDGGDGGHHDGAKAGDAACHDGFVGVFTDAFGFEGKVDDHDAIFLDDAQKQQKAHSAEDR